MGGFSFRLKKSDTLTPARKAAISRKAKSFGAAFAIANNGRKQGLVKYDFVETRSKRVKDVARNIWGDSFVSSSGFLVPRAANLQRGIKSVRVRVDRFGNIQRRIYASKRTLNGRTVKRGSWEVYIPIDVEQLVARELEYVMTLVAPYVIPTKRMREANPSLPWSAEVVRGDEIKRWGLMIFASMGLDLNTLDALLDKMGRYIIDAVQGFGVDETPMDLRALVGVRP